MNKVLVTGLGNGILDKDCSPCNFNYMTLVSNPSMMLWIDKLLITQTTWNTIQQANHPNMRVGKFIKLIMDYYKDKNLIEIIDTEPIFTEEVKSKIESIVDNDIKLAVRDFSNLVSITKSPNQFVKYNKQDYCLPILYSIYADLLLSKLFNANCLFDQYEINFCNLKFGISSNNPLQTHEKISGIDRIFNTFIPKIKSESEEDYLYYIYNAEQVEEKRNHISKNVKKHDGIHCFNCAYMDRCESKFLSQLEDMMADYSNWREYDELCKVREVINDILKEKNINNEFVMSDDIYNEFEKRKENINRSLHKVFPKLKHWCNLLTILSVPIDALSFSLGNIPTGIVSTTVTGASVVTGAVLDILEEKNKWVNFSLE